ncbi:MAG TPA: hypothetical protein VGC41_18270, partial [Kofleriaceae bacterium]
MTRAGARIVVALLVWPAVAAAEPRAFTKTYEYATLPEGESEVALWHEIDRDAWESSSRQELTERLQVSYGVLDHLEASLFAEFAQTTDQPFRFDDLRMQLRYRLADRGEWPVDVAIHVEGAKQFSVGEYDLRGELDLARDFGRITAAANGIANYPVGHDVHDADVTYAWAAGLSYELDPKLHVGAELFGNHFAGTTQNDLGPVIAVMPSRKLWLAVTAGFDLSDP